MTDWETALRIVIGMALGWMTVVLVRKWRDS